MESLRRKIKIFWTEHGTPILFWGIVLVALIFSLKILNQIAINNTKTNQNLKDQVKQEEAYKEDKENIELINIFLNYCKDGRIDEAYKLISESCKKDKYKTIEEFRDKYYYKFFSDNYEIQIDFNTNNNLYEIRFYKDILESGKVKNRNYITHYYMVQEEILDNKIYINLD